MKLFFLYLALLAAACAVLLLVDDPSRSGWLPECLFYKTTGYLCYGCGSTRALHALLHGHWLDSLRYNVLLVPTLIWLGTLFFIRDKTIPEGADRRRGRTCPVYRGAQYSAVVTAAFFRFPPFACMPEF